MKILFLSHYFPPEVNAPAVRTYEHSREWVRLGHEVHVVTCVPNHPHGRPYPGYRRSLWVQRELLDGIHVHRVWTYLAANQGFLRRTLSYVSYMSSAPLACLEVGRPDVLVATSPQFFCACAGLLAARTLRCPWVFELRDLWPASIAAVGAVRNGAVLRLLGALEMGLYRKADHIVALTEAFRDELVGRGVRERKLSVIANGIDPQHWAGTDRGAARKELGMDSRFVVSYVGTLGMAHRLGTVLEAAELLRDEHDLHFFLVGDGAERERLVAMARRRGLQHVSIVGQVPRHKARLYVAASDAALVVLRRHETFKTVIPSKIFEAMAARVPIVLGVEGEAQQVVERTGAGVCVEPENSEALAAAIMRLKLDPALCRRFGDNGRRAVCRDFNRQALARRMLSVLEAVAQEGRT